MDETIDEGDLGHLNHHELLHERYNDSVPVLSGTAAARPAANAVPAGTLYWATDTDTLSRSDGATWDALSAGATDHGALTGLADDDHPQYALDTDLTSHEGAADPHTGYRRENQDHTHQSTGQQAGTLDHGLALTGLTDDDHTQYHTAARHAAVDAADHGSGASADGTVLTSDGAGGAAWEAVSGGATYVYKTADEVVNNSIAMQDDDHLFFTIAANGVYTFEFFLDYFSGSTPDFKLEWIEPDGTFTIRTFYEDSGGTAQNITRYETTALWSASGSGVATANAVYGVGVIRAGGAGGTFKLQWAQGVATASDTTLRKGSWLSYKKLN